MDVSALLGKQKQIERIFYRLDSNKYISRSDIQLLASIRREMTEEYTIFKLNKSRKYLYNQLLIAPPPPHLPLILYKPRKHKGGKRVKTKKIYVRVNKNTKKRFILVGGNGTNNKYVTNMLARFNTVLSYHMTSSSDKIKLYCSILVLLEKVLEPRHDFYEPRDALNKLKPLWQKIYESGGSNNKTFKDKIDRLCGPTIKKRLSTWIKNLTTTSNPSWDMFLFDDYAETAGTADKSDWSQFYDEAGNGHKSILENITRYIKNGAWDEGKIFDYITRQLNILNNESVAT